MLQIDRVTAMGQRAAELLPEAPAAWDIDGYLTWRELVWSTARRLSALAGSSLAERAAGLEGVDVDVPITAQTLLDLAGVTAGQRRTTSAPAGAVEQEPDEQFLHVTALQASSVAHSSRCRSLSTTWLSLARKSSGCTTRRTSSGLGVARKGGSRR